MPFDWEIDEERGLKLSVADAKFIFEQAEKQLKDTIDTSQLITTRVTSLITLTAGLMSAMGGYAFTKHKEIDTAMLIALSFGATYMFLLCCYMVYVLMPRVYSTMGSRPRTLFHEHFFCEEFDGPDKRLIEYYRNEMVNYQQRMVENQQLNEGRWKHFKFSLWVLVLMPLLTISIYCVVLIIRG